MNHARRLTAAAMLLGLIAAGCRTGDDETAAAVAATTATTVAPTVELGTTVPSTSEPEAIDDPDLIRIDLTGVGTADEQTARSVDGLIGDIGERPMPMGPWFSTAFSEPLRFELPIAGRLLDQKLGVVSVEVGEPGSADHGLIEIVEAIAFASPTGPVPISTIGPDTEFRDTTTLARGIVDSRIGELSWRDLMVDSALVPDNFELPCRWAPEADCVDGPIAESGPAFMALDVPIRALARSFGANRLYVFATALGVDSVGATVPTVFEAAFELAATLEPTERTDRTERRPLATLSARTESIPPGMWFVDLDGVRAEFELTRATSATIQLSPTFVFVEIDDGQSDAGSWFFVQVFQGFVEGLFPDDSVGVPPSAAEYLAGLERLVGVDWTGEREIGGFGSTAYESGPGFDDSPFACGPTERPRNIDIDLRCTLWTADGWTMIESEPGVTSIDHYIEELGVVVGYTTSGVGAAAGPVSELVELVTTLRLTEIPT